MKKQIIYTKFIPRVFAATIDLFILSVILTPIMSFIAKYVFIYIFNDFFIQNNVNISDSLSVMHALNNSNLLKYVTLGKFLTYLLIVLTIHGAFMSIYFIGFWKLCSTTPGKMLMKMKIVDASNLERPSTITLIKRFLFYFTALFGITTILFSKRGQALHDKIAGTVVIKS